MPDISEILNMVPEGMIWLILTVVLAGLVRGFSGFGTALVFVPVAARFLEPTQVVVTLLIMDLLGPMLLVPAALRDGKPREVARLGLGALFGIPVGVWLLTQIDPVGFRWIASLAALALLVLLIGGWRYTRKPGTGMTVGIGGLAGVMGGFSGLTGPPIILLYLGGTSPAKSIRANIILFFTLTELIGAVTFWLNGLINIQVVTLGLIFAVPYTMATLTGSALFRRFGAQHFRNVAYGIIALAAISGLPLLD